MAFVEPLAAIFKGDMSVEATYNGLRIRGIYDNATRDAFGVAALSPRFHCEASDIPAPSEGDSITVRTSTYKVTDWQYDITGEVITLELELQ